MKLSLNLNFLCSDGPGPYAKIGIQNQFCATQAIFRRMGEQLVENNLKEIDNILKWLIPAGNSVPFERFGGSRDGGYLVPSDLEGIKGCFSPGVANRKDFEDELLSRAGVRSHLLDFSSELTKFKTPPLLRVFRRSRRSGCVLWIRTIQ